MVPKNKSLAITREGSVANRDRVDRPADVERLPAGVVLAQRATSYGMRNGTTRRYKIPFAASLLTASGTDGTPRPGIAPGDSSHHMH